MNTHVTVGGRTLAYPDPAPAVAAFLARVRAAALDDSVTPDQMILLVYGLDNPLLDKTVLPGRAMVTASAWGDPVYHVLIDLMAVKDVRLGRLDLVRAYAKYTVGVPDAAARLGITQQGVRAAIESYRLAAIYRKGQWWTCEPALAAFEAGRAARPKSAGASTAGGLTVRGGSADGLSLQVKAEGAEVAIDAKDGDAFTARVPAGWTRVVLKLTAKGPKPGVRVFVLEPAAEAARVEHGTLSVEGGFRVSEKVNNTRRASEVWKGATVPVAVGE